MDEKKRRFLKVSALGGVAAAFAPVSFISCLNNVLAPEDKADITLIGKAPEDAMELERFYKLDPSGKLIAGKNIKIEAVDNGEKIPATVSLMDGHPLITYGKGKNAATATLKRSGFSLVLVDGSGNILEGENGKASAGLFSPKDFSSFLKYGLESGIITTKDVLKLWRLAREYKELKKEAEDALAPVLLKVAEKLKGTRGELLDTIFSFGVKITAFALAIWLGSSIASAVLSGIAFVAFYVLLIGALALIFGKTESILGWISKVTGVEITIQDITNFFSKGAEYIGDLLAEITGVVRNSLAQ